MFCSNSTYAARCGARIRAKSPTNCDVHLAEAFLDTLSFLNPWKTDPLYKPFSSHRPGPCHNGSPEYTGFFL
ncbi:MAG: DUF6783 domain-containing protein [Blautia faecis]